MPHLTNQNPTAHALPMIDSPCCCCGTGLDLPLFLEFMRYSTALLYLDADAISREPSLDAINSRLEIGQRRAQTTFYKSRSVANCEDTRQNRATF